VLVQSDIDIVPVHSNITADRKYPAGPHNLLEKSYKRGIAPKEL
jgi:hypothetical protein